MKKTTFHVIYWQLTIASNKLQIHHYTVDQKCILWVRIKLSRNNKFITMFYLFYHIAKPARDFRKLNQTFKHLILPNILKLKMRFAPLCSGKFTTTANGNPSLLCLRQVFWFHSVFSTRRDWKLMLPRECHRRSGIKTWHFFFIRVWFPRVCSQFVPRKHSKCLVYFVKRSNNTMKLKSMCKWRLYKLIILI